MSEGNPQKRKVVVLSASVACMSPVVVALVKVHPVLAGVVIGLQVVTLVYVVAVLMKLKRQEQ